MELNREKNISKATIVDTIFHNNLSKGTIIYGTVISSEKTNDTLTSNEEGNRFFIIEDMYYYKGIPLKHMMFGEKLGYIEDFVKNQTVQQFPSDSSVVFTLPFMWGLSNPTNTTEINEDGVLTEYEKHKENIPYNVHHLQLRKLMDISPYINIPLTTILSKLHKSSSEPTKVNSDVSNISEMQMNQYNCDFYKPQYRYPTVFQVSADIQFDIYHLFACGKNKNMVYYNIAYIPNLKSSFFMNSLFRNIRENKNIDYIEESDTEEDFENTAEDKYVDLNKTINIECIFHQKFKRWVPVRVTDSSLKIIHISKLVSNYF
jgi:hypothetical protein